MKSYSQLIEASHLVRDLDSCLTTGDMEYTGTALEIAEKEGEELMHVVVDSTGQRQVLFFPHKQELRIPLDLLLKALEHAKQVVQIR